MTDVDMKDDEIDKGPDMSTPDLPLTPSSPAPAVVDQVGEINDAPDQDDDDSGSKPLLCL